MKTLFIKLLFSFLASLLIFLAVMSIIFFFGFQRSLSGWQSEKIKAIEDKIKSEIKEILLYDDLKMRDKFIAKIESIVPQNIYLIVYDSDRKPVYSKKSTLGGRGMMTHRRINEEYESNLPLKKVRDANKVVGYYKIGNVGFGMDRTNQRFLDSMKRTIWLSTIFAFVLAFLFSLVFSKRLSNSAKSVAKGIGRIASGDLEIKIPEEGGREISLIAASANELARKLKREEEIRKRWAGDVAHDLRTPVTALKLQFEAMADGVLELTKDRIVKNLKEISRIEILVNDLGELTLLESPEIKVNREKINTQDFFHELAHRFEYQLEKKSILVEWKKYIDSFKADENLLYRAVSNFISNAVNHTKKGGKVAISLKKDGSYYLFTIFNTGRGIPKDELDRVFDRLYRGEYARKTPGSGLGLTIARKIAELHGGDVIIKSRENYGTTVEMRIEA